MNILFIHSIDDISSPDKPLTNQAQMQFGISYISALVKRHGHNTKLVILSRMLGKSNTASIDKNIKDFSPGLICFTAVTTEYPFIKNMAGYIKKACPDIFLLAGGPHVSLNPDEAIGDAFDAVCIGEGEYPTLELVSQLEKNTSPAGIPNLWIKRDSKTEKNQTRPFLENLDSLPFPDRSMWQEWIRERVESEYAVLLGRGCPFQCTYCCNHALRVLASGPYVRLRSVDNIIEEIEKISCMAGKRNFYLEIETIGVNKSWVSGLCSKLEALNKTLESPLSFRTNLRITAGMDLEGFFPAFKTANFKTINIGVESGSEKIRRKILKRTYSNQDIINAVDLARKYGLKVYFYNLIGVPGETLDDFKETIKINRSCQPDRTFNHIFFPYPGTELYAICKNEGLLPKAIDTDLERCKAVLDLPGFRKNQIQDAFVWFDYNVYKGYKPLSQIFRKVIVSKLRSNSSLHRLYRKLIKR